MSNISFNSAAFKRILKVYIEFSIVIEASIIRIVHAQDPMIVVYGLPSFFSSSAVGASLV